MQAEVPSHETRKTELPLPPETQEICILEHGKYPDSTKTAGLTEKRMNLHERESFHTSRH